MDPQSRCGDCYDNASAESLWSRLKTEILEVREQPGFADLADAQAGIANYFGYYTHERLRSSISCQISYHPHQQLLQLSALNSQTTLSDHPKVYSSTTIRFQLLTN